jgi:acetyl esterase/lipase
MLSCRLSCLVLTCSLALLLAACAPEAQPPLPSPSATLVIPSPTPTSTPEPALPPTQALPSPEPSPTATVEAVVPEAMEVVVTSNLDYARDVQLDVYSPVVPGEWPVVLLLHGGGLSKASVSGLARAIAGQGVVVFAPTYASAEPSPGAISLGAEDAACAARYARANASAYGGDARRLVAAGHSAGGAFAVLLALAGDDFGGDCRVPDGSGRVDGVVGLDGAYDLMRYISTWGLEAAPVEAWLAISPYAQLERQPFRPGLAFWLFAGRETELVQDGQAMRDALTRAGYPVEFAQIPGVDHMGMASSKRPQTLLAIVELARGG